MTAMRRFAQVFLLTLAVLGMTVGSSVAADATPEGAKALQGLLARIVQGQKNAASMRGGELVMKGNLTVEPAGSYYAVTMPHASLVSADGARTEIGLIAINASHGDKPGLWKMSVAIPTPITTYNAQNVPVRTLDLGSQRMSGLWHETMENFVKLDARYENIRMQDIQSGVSVTLPVMTMRYGLNEDGKGDWSGPVDFVFENMSVTSPGGAAAKIGNLAINMNVRNLSPGAMKDYREKMNALLESRKGQTGAMSPEHTLAFYNMLTEFAGKSWDGFTSQTMMRDVQITRPASANEPSGGNLSFANIGLGFDMTGFRSGQVSLALRLAYDNLGITPVPPKFDELTPTTLNFDATMQRIPYNDMVALGRGSIQTMAGSAQMAPLAGIQALATLPGLLTKSGTSILLKDNVIGGKDYRVALGGTLTANQVSPQGFTGKGLVEIAGMDKILAVLNGKMASATDAQKVDLQKQIQTLTMIQALGQQKTDASGQQVRSYNFEANEAGQILLNGSDVSPLLMQGMRDVPQQPGTAPAAPAAP